MFECVEKHEQQQLDKKIKNYYNPITIEFMQKSFFIKLIRNNQKNLLN